MSEIQLSPALMQQVEKLAEARMEDSVDSLRDVVEVMQAMGIGDGEPMSSILTRADDQLARGRGQQALIAKAVPDMALAYDLYMGFDRDERVGPYLRRLVYGTQPQLGFVELTYLLEERLYETGLPDE